MVRITSETPVEEIVGQYPAAIRYGIEHGVSLFSCAGAFPRPLGELLRAKGIEDVEAFIAGLNDFLAATE
jgi:hypothetical protein